MTAEEMRNCTIASIKRLEREELVRIGEKVRASANMGEFSVKVKIDIRLMGEPIRNIIEALKEMGFSVTINNTYCTDEITISWR